MAGRKPQERSKGRTSGERRGPAAEPQDDAAKTPNDDENDAEPSALICMPWSAPATFSDDLKGACTECGQAIRYRPHAPKVDRYICLECYQGLASPDDKHEITAETIAELQDWLRKQQH